MENIYLLILGMALVTYLPRFLPFVLLTDKKLPKKLEDFLSNIPYAALGALIIPGVINAIPNHQVVSIVGIIIAFLFALLKDGVILPVLGSIGVCAVLLILGV